MKETTLKEPTIEEIAKANDARRKIGEKKEQASLAQAGQEALRNWDAIDKEKEKENAKTQANKRTDDQGAISDDSIKSEQNTHVHKIEVAKPHLTSKETIKAAIKDQLAKENKQTHSNRM